ncbi:MAG: hypothetical protein ABR985_03170 [Methanotrichaceae archaeon]
MTDYDKYQEEFNLYLDEGGELRIGNNFSMYPSQILLGMDETAYYEQLIEYVNHKKEDFSQIVYQNFPAPIAYFYQQTERGYDNSNHRIQLLRSTWESLIYILYGIVLGDVNFKKFSLNNIRIFSDKQPIRRKHLTDYKLGVKIEIMQKIIEFDKDNEAGLLISSYINSDIFDVIKKLNDQRNDVSHLAALSEQEAEDRFKELYPIVTDLLFELSFLENVRILKYVNNLGDIHKNRFKKFEGHSLQGQNYDKEFTDSELTKVISILNDQIILLELDTNIFNISPYIHFYFEGCLIKLCYFKKIDLISGNYIFEIIGGAEREIQINPNSITYCVNVSLEGLL